MCTGGEEGKARGQMMKWIPLYKLCTGWNWHQNAYFVILAYECNDFSREGERGTKQQEGNIFLKKRSIEHFVILFTYLVNYVTAENQESSQTLICNSI